MIFILYLIKLDYKIIQRLLLFSVLSNIAYSTISLRPEFSSNETFSIPIEINYSINNNLSIKHINRFYDTGHPYKYFLYHKYHRSNITLITEKSIFSYKNNSFDITIGRDYIDVNNELYFSKYSPSADHIKLNYFTFFISKVIPFPKLFSCFCFV